jgi:uncharacterized protein
MNDELFDWDDANISHLAAHEVFPEEVEDAILAEPVDVGFDVVEGEERWSYVGATHENRILRIVITMRGVRIRVLTAFVPSKQQRNFYLQWKAGLR